MMFTFLVSLSKYEMQIPYYKDSLEVISEKKAFLMAHLKWLVQII